MPRDHEAERRRAAVAAERERLQREGLLPPDDEPPIISTPSDRRNGNGKKWWWETWGKAIGGVLATLLLLFLYWVGGWALVFGAATSRAYQAPARVDVLEVTVNGPVGRQQEGLTARVAELEKGRMSEDVAKRILLALERSEKREQERRP